MTLNNKCVWILVALVVITVALVVYRARPKSNTDAAVENLKTTVENLQSRVDNIIAETKNKEVTARAESRKNTYALTDDELLSAINEMLSEYRRGH